jgi:hypothetical protein
MICEKCKNEIPDDSDFCPICGSQVKQPNIDKKKVHDRPRPSMAKYAIIGGVLIVVVLLGILYSFTQKSGTIYIDVVQKYMDTPKGAIPCSVSEFYIDIDGEPYYPTDTPFQIKDVRLGKKEWVVRGNIECGKYFSCKSMDSGTLNLEDGKTYYVQYDLIESNCKFELTDTQTPTAK